MTHGGGERDDAAPAVRVRGIYSTALTHLLERVVQASPPIRDRFDAAFPLAPADATVETTRDRQGVTVSGEPAAVDRVVDTCRVARDTLAWTDPAPRGAVFEGVVTDALGSGAVVDLGAGVTGERAEGFLPYDNAADYVDEGDVLRVQVRDPRPPWGNGRADLDTDLLVDGELATLARGEVSRTGQAARYEDLVSADPPEGWHVRWGRDADDADLDALDAALAGATDRAETLMRGIVDADPDETPALLAAPEETAHVWFGRESRFALDEARREVTATMPGHHRTKAATDAASAAVDFVEALCPELGADDDAFPFDVVTRQFGPRKGDRVAIGHGKPDGRLVTLGRGEVTEVADGRVVVEREMTGGGTYDALGVERQAGDIATTRFNEGKPWYATVYRGADGTKRGTYVNICTPVEVFPETVRYVDLHVDVVKTPDGAVRRVDDDELDAAVAAGDVPEPLAKYARAIASNVEDAL